MSRIGIFIKGHESIFTNGCVQQAYFTYKSIAETCDIDFLTIDDSCTVFEYSNTKVINICKDISVLRNYKTIIFSSLIVTQYEILNYIKMLGIKVIHMIVGNYYILNCEEFVFNVHEGVIENLYNEFVDEVWLMPMYKHARDYISAITKCPVYICPYVWEDELIFNYIKDKKINPQYNQIVDNRPLTIVIMEPNMSTHKNALPLLCALNKFFLMYPERLNCIHLLAKPGKNQECLKCIKHLDIVRANKIKLYGRIISLEIYELLNQNNSKYVILSTNIRNGLNFVHLECMSLGIPIIHNCVPYKDNGLYYDDNDNLVDFKGMIKHLNSIWDGSYNIKDFPVKDIIQNYNPLNKKNTKGYKVLLDIADKRNKSSIYDIINTLNNNLNTKITEIIDESKGVIVPINKYYDINIIKHNIEKIKIHSLPIVFYVENDILQKFRIDLKPIGYKNIDIIDTGNNESKLFALGNNKFRKTLFLNYNCLIEFDLYTILKECKDNTIIGFNIVNDLYNKEKIMSFREVLMNSLSKVLTKTDTILDDNIFFYQNNELTKKHFTIYYKNYDKFKDFLDLEYIVDFIVNINEFKTILINSEKKNLFDSEIVSDFLKGYYMVNYSNELLYKIVDVNDYPVNLNTLIHSNDNYKSYKYKIKDKVFRNLILD